MASFTGLREGELCGWEWPDFVGDALTVKHSTWKTVVNEPKTRASRQAAPVIPVLSKTLDEYRASMQNPRTGAMFYQGNGERMDLHKLAQRVIRPAVQASGLPWYGWHGFRRGIASNLYRVGIPMRKSCNGCCVMPNRTPLKTATSRPLIAGGAGRRCSGCRRS